MTFSQKERKPFLKQKKCHIRYAGMCIPLHVYSRQMVINTALATAKDKANKINLNCFLHKLKI